MRRALSLLAGMVACIVAASGLCQPIEGHGVPDEVLNALKGTSWNAIGIGRSQSQLSTAEITRLRRCEQSAMYFESWQPYYLDQVFETGISMRSHFTHAEFAKSSGWEVITLYSSPTDTKPEKLYLSSDGVFLTQVIPPASPHVFVRCDEKKTK